MSKKKSAVFLLARSHFSLKYATQHTARSDTFLTQLLTRSAAAAAKSLSLINAPAFMRALAARVGWDIYIQQLSISLSPSGN